MVLLAVPPRASSMEPPLRDRGAARAGRGVEAERGLAPDRGGQPEAMAILMRRTLMRTSAPIFMSLRLPAAAP